MQEMTNTKKWKQDKIYEYMNKILEMSIEYGEAMADIERQRNNEFREEELEKTIKYGHEMYIWLQDAIWELPELLEKLKEAE